MSTLSNFGVPLSGKAKTQLLQPKPKNRFRVRLYNFGPLGNSALDISSNVNSCGRPTRSMNEVTVHSYNSTAYYAGKAEWNAIDLTIRDDVSNVVTTLVGYQLQKQMNAFEQTTPLAGSDYKFDMYLDILNGADGALETWTIEGAFITSANYGEMDYSSAESSMISLTIRYDNATQDGGLMEANPVLLTGPAL